MNNKGARFVAVLVVSVIGQAGLAFGQDVVIAGRVTDETEAVLPGVTLSAVHIETGIAFTNVSDASGDYYLGPLRPGRYRVTATLPGFSVVTRDDVELLVGQRVQLNFTLTLSDVKESVTVTGAAPLLDTTQSRVAGNIDTRQMESLPLNGRNWMSLTMLTPGSRVNSTDRGEPLGRMAAGFQFNLDGQQVSSTQTFIGQPRYSREAIAEFELVSSRFDATQGRSQGIQVNAVSKSGTNRLLGSVSGYFRDDSLNAEDFIVHRVVPYSNQQLAASIGGPILRDRTHYFGYIDFERQPQGVTFTSPYPRFNLPDRVTIRRHVLSGFRVDHVFTTDTRLMVRGNVWRKHFPVSSVPGSTAHPSTLSTQDARSTSVFAQLTHTFNARTVYQISGGISSNTLLNAPLEPLGPQILLRNYTIGVSTFPIPTHGERVYSLRNDLTWNKGSTELKIGGEFLLPVTYLLWGNLFLGQVDATLGPPPANLEDLFPVWDDPSTWNIAALSPITRRYTQGVGSTSVYCTISPNCKRRKPQFGAYVQDNWRATSDLTLNLGLRWDFAQDPFANEYSLPPIRNANPEQEWLNFGPRLGFAYAVNDNTVVRGGWGVYFAGAIDRQTHTTAAAFSSAIVAVENDGRSNFAADPFNLQGGGHLPTLEEARAQARVRDLLWFTSDRMQMPYSLQYSVGIQRQLGSHLAIGVDYVRIDGKREESGTDITNENLSYNPATGRNFPFSDLSTRPFQGFGRVHIIDSLGRSQYDGLETSLTRRFADHWQLSASYALGRTKAIWLPAPTDTLAGPVSFPTAEDLGGYWGPSWDGAVVPGDQRHRVTLNGILELPHGFQASGLYFYGSGQHFRRTYGGDLGDTGGRDSRVRPDGTITPPTFKGRPLHRVDVRIERRFRLVGNTAVDGLIEVFNLFNHENHGSYNTNEASPLFGQPTQNLAVEYLPRMMQLGFRVTF